VPALLRDTLQQTEKGQYVRESAHKYGLQPCACGELVKVVGSQSKGAPRAPAVDTCECEDPVPYLWREDEGRGGR
jgi:hypothetical protein